MDMRASSSPIRSMEEDDDEAEKGLGGGALDTGIAESGRERLEPGEDSRKLKPEASSTAPVSSSLSLAPRPCGAGGRGSVAPPSDSWLRKLNAEGPSIPSPSIADAALKGFSPAGSAGRVDVAADPSIKSNPDADTSSPPSLDPMPISDVCGGSAPSPPVGKGGGSARKEKAEPSSSTASVSPVSRELFIKSNPLPIPRLGPSSPSRGGKPPRSGDARDAGTAPSTSDDE
jgi:hypothetical protein